MRAPLWWFFTATDASISGVVPNSCMCRVANGANRAGAVSPRVKIGCPDTARDSSPSSADLSRIFSTPMTRTTSCTPLATAIAPTRNASAPDGHAFSIRVHGDTGEPDRGGNRVAADALLAPERPALGGDERRLHLGGLEALVDAVDRGGERAGRHLLVALLEQLPELDEPGSDDGDLVPAHRRLRLGRRGLGVVPVVRTL